jgi:hypothetical protein
LWRLKKGKMSFIQTILLRQYSEFAKNGQEKIKKIDHLEKKPIFLEFFQLFFVSFGLLIRLLWYERKK